MEVNLVARTSIDDGALVENVNPWFSIIIAETVIDEHYMMVYGVINVKTRIVESYTNSLAKARYLAAEFYKDVTEGFTRESAGSAGLLAALLGNKDETPPRSGKAN